MTTDHAAREARLKGIGDRIRLGGEINSAGVSWILAELSSADQRAEEIAGLMREAAQAYEMAVRKFWTTNSGAIDCDTKPPFCGRCSTDAPNHKPDCLVTRLRTAADHAGEQRCT